MNKVIVERVPKKWENEEKNLMLYMSLRGSSRKFISQIINRKQDLIFSKLQKHLIMLMAVRDVLTNLQE